MSTDDASRRDTPLAEKLKARIRREGPLSVADFMHACLQDPEFGYYVTQPAIGRAGDFITAPEISQVFGELIGLWAAVVWQQMGSPPRVNLVELGPGRGTLMRDALRAARLLPDFFAALSVHLVESNETLRSEQAATLADAGVPLTFHSRMKKVFWDDTVLGGLPTIVIGNEFLDTFGVHQFVFADDAWRAREVSLDVAGQLQFVVNDQNAYRPKSLPLSRDPVDGDVFESSVELAVFAGVYLARCAQNGPFAALFLDYGHEATGFGDTLQAVADHKSVPPLFAPGESRFDRASRFCAVPRGVPASGGRRTGLRRTGDAGGVPGPSGGRGARVAFDERQPGEGRRHRDRRGAAVWRRKAWAPASRPSACVRQACRLCRASIPTDAETQGVLPAPRAAPMYDPC